MITPETIKDLDEPTVEHIAEDWLLNWQASQAIFKDLSPQQRLDHSLRAFFEMLIREYTSTPPELLIARLYVALEVAKTHSKTTIDQAVIRVFGPKKIKPISWPDSKPRRVALLAVPFTLAASAYYIAEAINYGEQLSLAGYFWMLLFVLTSALAFTGLFNWIQGHTD